MVVVAALHVAVTEVAEAGVTVGAVEEGVGTSVTLTETTWFACLTRCPVPLVAVTVIR